MNATLGINQRSIIFRVNRAECRDLWLYKVLKMSDRWVLSPKQVIYTILIKFMEISGKVIEKMCNCKKMRLWNDICGQDMSFTIRNLEGTCLAVWITLPFCSFPVFYWTMYKNLVHYEEINISSFIICPVLSFTCMSEALQNLPECSMRCKSLGAISFIRKNGT